MSEPCMLMVKWGCTDYQVERWECYAGPYPNAEAARETREYIGHDITQLISVEDFRAWARGELSLSGRASMRGNK